MDDHSFCQQMLRQIRRDAARAGIDLPKKIRAIRSSQRQFFVEANGVEGRDYKAHCAFEAKGKMISSYLKGEYVEG